MNKSHSMYHSLAIVHGWLSRRRKLQLLALLFLSLLGAVAELATLGAVVPFLAILSEPEQRDVGLPVVTRWLSSLGPAEGSGLILPMAVLFFSVVLVAALIRLTLAWALTRFSQGLGHDIGTRIFERMLRQPYTFHVSKNSSELLAGMTKVGAVVGGVVAPALDAFVAAIMAIAVIAGLLLVNAGSALLAAGTVGLAYLGLSAYSKTKVLVNSKVISAGASARLKAMQEGLGGVRDVLLDGSQSLHVDRFRIIDDAFRRAAVRNSLWNQLPRFLVEALGMGVIAAVAVVAVSGGGRFSDALPTLGALALGAQKLLPLFQRVYGGWSSVAGNQGNLEDTAELVELPLPEGLHVSAPNRRRLPFNHEISLIGVGYRYQGSAPWVLRGVDLRIEKGARVGFKGKTGCGKSTILDICMGLLLPVEGRIEIDGVPLTSETLRDWQARIAHVPQNIFLADTTIAANIAFGEAPGAISKGRTEEAARRARIDEFIQGLKDGYDTRVGERGVWLSGGQRQRIGIARALYRNADVIVLDEATSALDHQTESSVMDGIGELGCNVTILMVAHRLSTLEVCDFVVDMDTQPIDSVALRAAKSNFPSDVASSF